MRLAPAAATVSLALLFALQVHAQAPAPATPKLAEARKKLDAAREQLARAVKRIQKDPPDDAELEAAHQAVGVLKEAIDAGAAHEPNDLGYAKAALAARKELRTGREYVDQRRANVHLHNHRRTLDAALAKLTEKLRPLQAREPGAKDFEEARAALDAVKKTADAGREFAAQDGNFAKYLTEVDATLARQQKAIDDRWVQLSADKHRAVVTESRQALSRAMAALTRGRTDAEFEAANRAADALTTRLEEGKPLEGKDKAYAADAAKGRAELAQAKKRMEELVAAVGLDKLKSEIDPAYKDLVAAAKPLRARKPTEDQLGEARTAAIVVRKLVERFEPQASLNKAFGQYVSEVKKTLVEVEVDLQRRNLESAQRDVVQALGRLEKRSVTDEHFSEANTALTILQKTLEETQHKRDPAMLKPVADAREVIRNANTLIPRRRLEVDLQRQRERVEEARKNAESLLRQLQQPNPGEERIKEAEGAIAALATLLEEGAPLMKRTRDSALYARDMHKRVAELKQRLEARKVALAAAAGRKQLGEAITTAKARLDAAKEPTSKDAELDAAAASVDALMAAIESGATLEQQDAGYAASAERAREQLMRLMEALELARQARAVRKETVEAFVVGASAAQAGAGAKDLRAQKAQYEKAIAGFKSCESGGAGMVKDNPALAKVAVVLEGSPSTAREVIALCGERSKATEQQLRQVMSVLGFEDGAKKSYETAVALVAKGKQSEALPHFGECISSGRVHQHWYPEIKEQKFQVAGGSLTVGELVERCMSERNKLAGGK